MSVMSIRIDDQKRKQLKAIASIQGKTMSSIVEGLIEEYIRNFYHDDTKSQELRNIMRASEPSFDEWDNDEDDVYNDI
jgi:predicted DNA-binding protein